MEWVQSQQESYYGASAPKDCLMYQRELSAAVLLQANICSELKTSKTFRKGASEPFYLDL